MPEERIPEERMDDALKALRHADQDVEPGRGAEVRALLAFRRQQRRRTARRVAWTGTIAAAIAAVLLSPYAPPEPAKRPVIALAIPIPTPPATAPPMRTVARKTRQPEEIVTPFYPLMPSQPPLESGVLVRVTVQASALRSVGIPVAEEHLSDPVMADVLVGQDDLARAIRFVSYQ